MHTIRLERAGDGVIVDALVAEIFGPGRFAKSAYRLREGVDPIAALSFVAERDGKVVGTVRYWPVAIGGAPAIMLGPIAVRNELRGQGIAIALMQQSLERAKELGHRAVILVGDEPYYGRVGFARIQPFGRIAMPGPVDQSRVLGLALQPGALDNLKGSVARPHLDNPHAASGAPIA